MGDVAATISTPFDTVETSEVFATSENFKGTLQKSFRSSSVPCQPASTLLR